MWGFVSNRFSGMFACLAAALLITAYPAQAQNSGGASQPEKQSPPGHASKVAQTLQDSFWLQAMQQAGQGQTITPWARYALSDSDGAGKLVDYLAFTNGALATHKRDLADEMMGATLQPVGEVLRAQLDIPNGQGLLIAGLRTDGPSAQAGLKQNDILLTLSDKPIGTVEELSKTLRLAGEAPVYLKLLRTGKTVSIPVRPVYHVSLGPVAQQKTEYFIGVSIDPLDETLRSQLGIPAGQGVVVKEVTSGSPAEKQGIKKYDIVLELDGKQVESPEKLAAQVQAAKGKAISIKVLRTGKPLTVAVTPTERATSVTFTHPEEYQLLFLDRQQLLPSQVLGFVQGAQQLEPAAAAPSPKLTQRLEEVEKELKAIRQAMEKLDLRLKNYDGAKRE